MDRQLRPIIFFFVCIYHYSLCQGSASASTGVSDFVSRFYQLILGRNPEPAGLNHWVDSLEMGRGPVPMLPGNLSSAMSLGTRDSGMRRTLMCCMLLFLTENLTRLVVPIGSACCLKILALCITLVAGNQTLILHPLKNQPFENKAFDDVVEWVH